MPTLLIRSPVRCAIYENEMGTPDVADGLDDVEALIDKLIPLLNQT